MTERTAEAFAALCNETDRLLHEAAQRMTPIARLRMLARMSGPWGTLRFSNPEHQKRIIENRLAHVRRVVGWVEDCPIPPQQKADRKS